MKKLAEASSLMRILASLPATPSIFMFHHGRGGMEIPGVQTFSTLIRDVFNRHLLKVIRSRFWELLKDTEQSIREEAKEHKEEAKKELEKQLNIVDSL